MILNNEYITQSKILIFWIANVELQTQSKVQILYVLYQKHAKLQTQSNIQIFWMFNTEYQTQSNIQFFKYLISRIWQIKFEFWIDLVFRYSRFKKIGFRF